MRSYEEFRALRYFAPLDGVRAVAILLVFTAHPAYQQFWHVFRGTVGVSIFFVLSGFLITSLAVREEERGGKLSMWRFYARRLFRIYPVFFLVFATYMLLVVFLGFVPESREIFVREIPYFVFGFPEHAHYFLKHRALHMPFDGAWSIGVEEKFYLLWPLVGFAALRRRPLQRVILLFILIVGVIAARLTLGPNQPVTLAEPYVLLAVGCLCSLLLHNPKTYRLLRFFARPELLFVLGVAMVSLVCLTPQIQERGSLYVLFGALGAFFMIGLVCGDGHVAKIFSVQPMRSLGEISYIFYLIHNFFLNLAEKVIPQTHGLASSLGSSMLAFVSAVLTSRIIRRMIEKPGIQLGRRVMDKLSREVNSNPGQVEYIVTRTDQLSPYPDAADGHSHRAQNDPRNFIVFDAPSQQPVGVFTSRKEDNESREK